MGDQMKKKKKRQRYVQEAQDAPDGSSETSRPTCVQNIPEATTGQGDNTVRTTERGARKGGRGGGRERE